ncbi:MAG TPA: bifunctional 4-hydroxy-3-methylbut-2-enyl diphosphate reductase/30S ribosomal protein S1 [Clostridiales bacterium]|nr:bifunctional 4-hydroxy-3-methylbut-2-enyl diphosphate reductase/30S ribosomal protein S1 [Clostridiales bacterium]
MVKKVILAKNIGFCFGVEKAINTAKKYAPQGVCSLGPIIHNRAVVKDLVEKGLKTVKNIDEITSSKVIIRSHGAGKAVYDELQKKGIEIIDATCPFVKKIHKIVQKYHSQGYQIVIAGIPTHSEVIGINGWCDNTAIVISSSQDIPDIELDKICVVAQTTFSVQEFERITEYFNNLNQKSVVVFNTICYTTNERQEETVELSQKCDCMIVIGCSDSSNTNKLLDICKHNSKNTYLVEKREDLESIFPKLHGTVGITAGASTPSELILEVNRYMNDNINEGSFEALLESNPVVNYVKGTKVKDAEILFADEKGIHVKLDGKNDGLIAPDEVELNGEYNPENYNSGDKIDIEILGPRDKDTGCIPASKKKIEEKKLQDKLIDGIRNGEEFSITVRVVKGGLLGRYGGYRVFVPQSHVEERYVTDLTPYNKQKIRLTVLEIDDNKRKITASKKIILAKERKAKEQERRAKEDEVLQRLTEGDKVTGKFVRATPFGAFVDVDGLDCLCRISDLSWNRVGKVEDVLTLNEEYEFLVLSVDREKRKVGLGYKQLHPHPFQEIAAKYPVGSIVTGQVARLEEYGAFVDIENNIRGLVHISEAARDYIKNINDVLKVGDEVAAKVIKIDEENRKISLSIKAALPEEEKVLQPKNSKSEEKPKESHRRAKVDRSAVDIPTQWKEGATNTPLAELLKDFK